MIIEWEKEHFLLETGKHGNEDYVREVKKRGDGPENDKEIMRKKLRVRKGRNGK